MTAPTVPPITWFRDPGFTELTPLTVTPEGRVFGHLAGWSTPHRSFPGRNITAPRSRSNYRHFRTGSVQVRDGDEIVDVSAGNLTIGPGHADTHLSAADTSAYYDSACSIVAQVGIGEDAHGVWVAGALLPDVDDITLRRFRACSLSGDWRALDGHLDLVAALAVPVPGFPVPRARVASGAPLALVAAGVLAPAPSFGRRVDPAWNPVEVGGQPAGKAEQVALLAQLDDTPTLVAGLLAELDETPQQVAALLAALDEQEIPADLGELSADDVEALGRLDRSPKKNWVEEQGGLPDYIDRIANHLHGKGMSISHAIATAIRAAKTMCSTGDLNWPGLQQVNPGSKAQACAAVARWEAMKKAARSS